MTRKEADDRAAKLGLSTWMLGAVAAGPDSRVVPVMCVGFASLDMPLGEGESWEEALEQAARIIFAT